MNLYWNAFGAVNLVLDLAIAAVFFGLVYMNSRLQPSKATLTICRQAILVTLLVWILAGLFVGGIIGFSLIARTFWTLLTAAVPLLLVFYAVRLKKAALIMPALLLVAFKYYGEVYEPRNLEVQRASLPVKGLKGSLRIAHISDLQTDGLGRLHQEVLAAVNGYEPDLILFTGDVRNHPSLDAPVRDYLGGFKSRYGAFFVGGNVDGLLDTAELFKGTAFRSLDGDYKKIKTGAGNIGLVGLGLEDSVYRGALEGLLGKLGPTEATLLLSHVPDALRITQGLPVTALFSGHTHGGQMCLPWAGPIFTLSGVDRKIAAGGIHPLGGLYVVVSRGLGMEGHIAPRARTFCRPQVLLLDLKPEP